MTLTKAAAIIAFEAAMETLQQMRKTKSVALGIATELNAIPKPLWARLLDREIAALDTAILLINQTIADIDNPLSTYNLLNRNGVNDNGKSEG